MRGTVRIVFERLHGGTDSGKLALEINDPQFSAVRAAAVAHRYFAGIIAAGIRLDDTEQTLLGLHFGKAGIVGDGHLAPARRCRLIRSDSHLVGHTPLKLVGAAARRSVHAYSG
jgi:hypothetical protein